jgi:transposase
MIPSGVQIFVALEPVNMRLSFDRLAGLALEQTGYDARGGALFLFFGKRRDALKILFADSSGLCLFYKRLDRGLFRIPQAHEMGCTHIEIDDTTLDALLDGIAIDEKPRRIKKPRIH